MENLEKLKTLQTMLGCEKFILTGSNAVALHGIRTGKKADDLDVVLVDPTSAATEVLERFQKESPNPKFTGKGTLTYSFFFEKVKVDVWVQITPGKIISGKEKSHTEIPVLKYEGIWVASLDALIAAKKSYNRAKDWIQLMRWAGSIFDMDSFKAAIPAIEDKDEYPAE